MHDGAKTEDCGRQSDDGEYDRRDGRFMATHMDNDGPEHESDEAKARDRTQYCGNTSHRREKEPESAKDFRQTNEFYRGGSKVVNPTHPGVLQRRQRAKEFHKTNDEEG